MKHFQGIVSRIGSKTFGTPPNDKVSYYFFLEGIEGLFKMNGKRPTFKEHAEVSFDTNDTNVVTWDSIKSGSSVPTPVREQAATISPPTAAASPAAAPAKYAATFDRYRDKEWAEAERRNINRQFARRLAVETALGLAERGILSLPAKGHGYDAFLAHVDALTDNFYQDIVHDHPAELVKAAAIPEENTIVLESAVND